jgi:hypothetical protein
MFPDLKDKEYVADMLRAIQERQEEIEDDLTLEDKAEVKEAIDAMTKFGDLEYYVDNTLGVNEYQAAKQSVKELGGRNGCLLDTVIFVITGSVLMYSLSSILAGFLNANGGIVILGLIGIYLSITAFVRIRKWQRPEEYKNTKKILEESEIDMDRFRRIERKYKIDSLEDGRRQHRFAKIQVENFFGDDGPAQLTAAEG